MFKDGRKYKEIYVEIQIEIWLQNIKRRFIGMMNNVIKKQWVWPWWDLPISALRLGPKICSGNGSYTSSFFFTF